MLDSDGDLVAVVTEYEKLPTIAFSAPTTLWKAELIEIPFDSVPVDDKKWWMREHKKNIGQRTWKLVVYLNVKTYVRRDTAYSN